MRLGEVDQKTTEKINVICGCPLRSYHAPVRSFWVAEICIYRGPYLSEYIGLCQKGTMPQNCMPKKEMP